MSGTFLAFATHPILLRVSAALDKAFLDITYFHTAL